VQCKRKVKKSKTPVPKYPFARQCCWGASKNNAEKETYISTGAPLRSASASSRDRVATGILFTLWRMSPEAICPLAAALLPASTSCI
jgi:hypothetical protein